MKIAKRFALAPLCVASFALPTFAADPLPSWNDTASHSRSGKNGADVRLVG